MKFIGIPVVGIVGGIIFGSLGTMSFWDSAIWQSARGQTVTVAKPIIHLPETPSSTDPSSDENQTDIPPGNEIDTAATAEQTLRRKVALMEQGLTILAEKKTYTARIQKQEVVRGELLAEQIVMIKCRHTPFSVYLNWEKGDVGREVIYIEGQNDGKMIAHDGGWKARIPAFHLSIDCMMAMRDARYPVTTAGLAGLMGTMLSVHRDDLERSNYLSCECDANVQFEGRPCNMFTTIYRSRAESSVYRKSVTLLDKEWNVPLHSRHFEWPKSKTQASEDEMDEHTLIESYTFSDIQFECPLTDRDFDPKCSEYHFR